MIIIINPASYTALPSESRPKRIRCGGGEGNAESGRKYLGRAIWHSICPVADICGFFLGGLLGCVLAFRVSGSGSEYLTLYLKQFLSSAGEGLLSPPPLLLSVWETVRWPLFVFGLSFTTFGASLRFRLSLEYGDFCSRSPSLPLCGCLVRRVYGWRFWCSVYRVVCLPVLFCVGGSGMAGIPCPGDPTFGGAEKDASLWKNLFFALWPVCLCAMCVCLPGVCRCAGSGGQYGGAVPALTAGRSR